MAFRPSLQEQPPGFYCCTLCLGEVERAASLIFFLSAKRERKFECLESSSRLRPDQPTPISFLSYFFSNRIPIHRVASRQTAKPRITIFLVRRRLEPSSRRHMRAITNCAAMRALPHARTPAHASAFHGRIANR